MIDSDKNSYSDPTVVAMICPSCNGNAQIRVLTVTIPNETPTVISSFNCSDCHLTESATFDGDIGNGTGITISCNFDSPADLQRYIRLPRFSVVKFMKGEEGFQFTTGSTGIFVVEAIIRKSIDDLGGIFNIQTSSISSIGQKQNEEIEDRDVAEIQVRIMQDLLKDPKFQMEIVDKTGIARVAPRGRMLSEIEDENEYDDGFVRNTFFEVKEEEAAIGEDK